MKKSKEFNEKDTDIFGDFVQDFGKEKAGSELFNNFEKFEYIRDGSNCYHIQAPDKRSMFDSMLTIREKISFGSLSSMKKSEEVIPFFCKKTSTSMVLVDGLSIKERLMRMRLT